MNEFVSLSLVTFFLGFCCIGLSLWIFPKIGFLDKPEKYGHKRKAVPYGVGLVMFLLFFVLVFLNLEITTRLLVLMLSLSMLVFVSFLDDYYNVPPVFRLFVQLLCASAAVWSGAEVLEISNPFSANPLELGAFSFALSVLWIVLLTNLVNFLDGVSGLSSGVSAIGFFVLFGLSIWPGVHVTDQSLVATMSLILGFLALTVAFFEFPVPKLLMGDSGAMFFGFMLGVLSLINGGKLATVALVLLIPIFDGIWAISRRLYEKKSPFKGDLAHFHHRLLGLGISEGRLLGTYYLLSLFFGLIALFSWNTFFKVISLTLFFVGLIFVSYVLFYGTKRRNKS